MRLQQGVYQLTGKGVNPATKSRFRLRFKLSRKIARATEQDVDSLIKILDGKQPVTIDSNVAVDGDGAELLKGFIRYRRSGKTCYSAC